MNSRVFLFFTYFFKLAADQDRKQREILVGFALYIHFDAINYL